MEKRTIAAFDFDGTLTTKDTLLEFIKFAKGRTAFYAGFALYSPILVAYKLRLYPNWKAKQRVFAHFFKGTSYEEFCQQGQDFSRVVEGMVRQQTLAALNDHLRQGHTVYIVSASIEEWVKPWADRHGVSHVLGTQVEVAPDGRLTGRFLTANCYGQEKVNRLLQAEPDRQAYTLYAYGDSRGDREMIEFADCGTYI